MRNSLIAIISLLSMSAFAETTLRIPLAVEENGELVLTSDINVKYDLKGEDKIPAFFEVSTSSKVDHDRFWNLKDKVEKIAEKKNADFELQHQIPGGVQVKGNYTCYTGEPKKVVGLIYNLADSIYSDQLGVIAWKFKKEVKYYDEWDTQEEMNKYLEENSPLWKKWIGYDETILVLTHESDSGDDVNEGIIKKCE